MSNRFNLKLQYLDRPEPPFQSRGVGLQAEIAFAPIPEPWISHQSEQAMPDLAPLLQAHHPVADILKPDRLFIPVKEQVELAQESSVLECVSAPGGDDGLAVRIDILLMQRHVVLIRTQWP